MSNSIAVINAGSSSVKFAIYQATKDERCTFPRTGRRNWRRAAA